MVVSSTETVNHAPNGGSGGQKYISVPDDQEIVVDRGIGEYLYESMHKYKDNIAQIDSMTGHKESYSQLLRRVIRKSHWLLSLGLTTKDVISMCCYNNMDYTVTVLASFFTGVTIAPMDPSCPTTDIVHCLKLTKPRLVFCEQDSAEMIRLAIQETGLPMKAVVFEDPQNSFKLWEAANENSMDDDSFPVVKVANVLDTAIILFSSGTTGMPKAVCVTHYSMFYQPTVVKNRLDNPKVLMTVSSPYWISNISLLVWAALFGSARVIYKKFDETNIIKIIHNYEVELTLFTPLNANKLLQHPEYCKYDTSKLKYVFVGGSASVARQIEQIISLFPHSTVFNGFGMTEMGGVVFYLYEQTLEQLHKSGKTSVGQPIHGFTYKVIAENERPVEPNEPGELRIKFRGVMNAYYQQPELYASAFDSEGFLKTGDIVYYDNDLRFYYVDRLKEIFKYQGWHISPVYIEAELMTHPNVKEAAVVGLPTENAGELPTACVALHDASQTKAEEIAEYIAKKLPDRYHLRGGVHIIENIPVTASGKLRRKDLRAMVLELRNKINT